MVSIPSRWCTSNMHAVIFPSFSSSSSSSLIIITCLYIVKQTRAAAVLATSFSAACCPHQRQSPASLIPRATPVPTNSTAPRRCVCRCLAWRWRWLCWCKLNKLLTIRTAFYLCVWWWWWWWCCPLWRALRRCSLSEGITIGTVFVVNTSSSIVIIIIIIIIIISVIE